MTALAKSQKALQVEDLRRISLLFETFGYFFNSGRHFEGTVQLCHSLFLPFVHRKRSEKIRHQWASRIIQNLPIKNAASFKVRFTSGHHFKNSIEEEEPLLSKSWTIRKLIVWACPNFCRYITFPCYMDHYKLWPFIAIRNEKKKFLKNFLMWKFDALGF